MSVAHHCTLDSAELHIFFDEEWLPCLLQPVNGSIFGIPNFKSKVPKMSDSTSRPSNSLALQVCLISIAKYRCIDQLVGNRRLCWEIVYHCDCHWRPSSLTNDPNNVHDDDGNATGRTMFAQIGIYLFVWWKRFVVGASANHKHCVCVTCSDNLSHHPLCIVCRIDFSHSHLSSNQ